MVGPPIFEIRLPRRRQDGGYRIGDVRGGGWATDLIIYDLKLAPFSGKTQHGPDEVRAVRAVNPGRTQNHMLGASRSHSVLAFGLAEPIGTERSKGIVFAIGRSLGPVEDVIRGNLDKRRPD
jgi:hypothetical protein